MVQYLKAHTSKHPYKGRECGQVVLECMCQWVSYVCTCSCLSGPFNFLSLEQRAFREVNGASSGHFPLSLECAEMAVAGWMHRTGAPFLHISSWGFSGKVTLRLSCEQTPLCVYQIPGLFSSEKLSRACLGERGWSEPLGSGFPQALSSGPVRKLN